MTLFDKPGFSALSVHIAVSEPWDRLSGAPVDGPKTRVKLKKAIYLALMLIIGAATLAMAEADGETGEAMTAETQTGVNARLHVPMEDFRREWALLGVYSVLGDDPEKGAKELHVVYAKREVVAAYRESGTFPDGAVLVKEVFAARTEALTTGTASYAGTLVGRFVMVKDNGNGYAGASPLWGDGWGWAFYRGEETKRTVTTDYRRDCLGCHEPARGRDFIYLQGYPVLKR